LRVAELLIRQKNNANLAIKKGKEVISYQSLHLAALKISKVISTFLANNSLCATIFLQNSINYAKAYFAILYANKIVVPVDPRAKSTEILSVLTYCESDLIITDSQNLPYIKESLSEYAYKVFVFNIDTFEIYFDNYKEKVIKKSDVLSQDLSDDDVAIMLHTSGTTSNPKRVMLTHSNLINNIESNIFSLNLTKNDRVLISLPMYFGYCNTAQFLTHIYLGASIIILDTMFLPKQFFQTIEHEKITNFTGVPSMLLMLLEYRYAEKYDYSSLRYICFGGGKMPENKLEMLIEKYHSIGFVQTYGQTECSPRVTALMPKYALSKLGSVGTPIPGVKVIVINKTMQKCKANVIGEIVVSGKNVMKGYFKQPEITKKTIINGWVHTGDLGYIDEGGFLYLTGRKKNVIISGGVNIYPEEIEQILLEHEAVSEVCVVAEEHERLGEVPVAKVILKSKVTAEELSAHCRDRLSYYKVPVKYLFVSDLPKTYNGKIRRH
jgi:long-chain acyl-CoA synthetase